MFLFPIEKEWCIAFSGGTRHRWHSANADGFPTMVVAFSCVQAIL